MVIKLERLFVEQFAMCPINFQEKFRKIYQQLKIVDNPTEVKEVRRIKEKNFFKLYIDKSRIGVCTQAEQNYALPVFFIINFLMGALKCSLFIKIMLKAFLLIITTILITNLWC